MQPLNIPATFCLIGVGNLSFKNDIMYLLITYVKFWEIIVIKYMYFIVNLLSFDWHVQTLNRYCLFALFTHSLWCLSKYGLPKYVLSKCVLATSVAQKKSQEHSESKKKLEFWKNPNGWYFWNFFQWCQNGKFLFFFICFQCHIFFNNSFSMTKLILKKKQFYIKWWP